MEMRISNGTLYLMTGIAFLLELIQAACELFNIIPFAGTGIAIILGYALDGVIFLTFFVWFAAKSVSFIRAKKPGKRLGWLVIEVIPVLNALPVGWTLAVWRTAKQAQEEDKEKANKQSRGTMNLARKYSSLKRAA